MAGISGFFSKKSQRLQGLYRWYLEQNEKRFSVPKQISTGLGRLPQIPTIHPDWIRPGLFPTGKGTMIQYFRKSLRLLVWVKIEQRGQELNNFEEIVEKVVDAKVKAALRPRFYTCNTDKYCVQGSWPSTAKTSTQGQPIKDPRVEEPKPRY